MNRIYPRRVFILAMLLTLADVVLSLGPVSAAETFALQPGVEQVDGQAVLRFAVAAPIDVEVAIISAKEMVVRHLAAGALGGEQAPPAPLVRGLSQRLTWDGLDDDGQRATGGPFRFRIRTGMGVKLDAVAGGDPYAFWTEQSGQGDHAQWRITGLDAKRDGSVFLFGNFTPFGLPTLRQYDARGNYRRTVFPPPAGKPVEDVRGWGVNERGDGTWTLRPKYGWSSQASEWTLMVSGDGTRSGRLVPTPEQDLLSLVSLPGEGNQTMQFSVDGTLKQFTPTVSLGGEALPKQGLIRSFFSALSSDGKSLYVSGLSTLREGFWREGQIWKVDLATRTTSIFFSLNDNERQDRAAIGHSDANPYSAFQGVAVDREGNVFVCDRMNRRVVVVGPDGKVIRSLAVANPDAVAVCPRSKSLYVTTRFGNYSGNGKLELLKFADWSQDDAPTVTLSLRDRIGTRQESSLLAVVEDNGEILVWVAYTQLPARIYKDAGKEFVLVKDFYEAGSVKSDECSGILLVAAAGYGKSCILNQVLVTLEEQMPVVAFKLDSVAECTTADRLGRELDLPGSPVAILSHLAEGKPSVLLIDQLDAISTVSGRKTGTWEALAEIIVEARNVPGLKLILACRDFDLNQDHRLRQLSSDKSGFKKLVVSKLSDQTVLASLEKAGLVEFKPSAAQLEILSLPFHLLLFLQGDPRRAFTRISDLFDTYWNRKRVQTKEMLRREPKWNEVIDILTKYMSDNQCLVTPEIKVDDYADDANVMASAHVLVREESSYRFFHESFFDYAYARRFCKGGESLLAFLSSDEQHLFRRAQVRQILTFRREKDFVEYLRDLREVLASDQVRFHIKRMVASELHRIADPTPDEWEVVRPHAFGAELSNYIWGAFRSHVGWFDLLDDLGMWTEWLASEAHQNHVLWIISDLELQKLRSARIAEFVKPYVELGGERVDHLKQFFSWGAAYLSDQMANVFFEFVRRGVYDVEERLCRGRDLWGTLYEASEERPTFVIDTLRIWFVYTVEKYDDGKSWNFLDKCPLNKSYQGCQVVAKAASAESSYFLQTMLPLFVETCVNTQASRMDRVTSRAWPWLTNSDDPFDINDAILVHLRKSLEQQAMADPTEFRRNIEPLTVYRHDPIAYLLLSGFAANPREFADECIRYLISDKTRLNLGYASWSGGGSGESALSRSAIKTVSPFCDESLLRDLENAVIDYADEYERTTPGQRGYGEFLVLKSIDFRRISNRGNVRIHELKCSYPGIDAEIPPISTSAVARAVGSPITAERAALLKDKQWISAMQRYDGSTDRFKGGPRELSRLLREFTRKNRQRFASLALIMPATVRPEYFDAILDGMTSQYLNVPADEKPQDDKEISELDTRLFIKLIFRMHELPRRPCGTSIVHCVGRISERELPDEVLDVVSYYATNDPDPDEDIWQRPDGNWYGRDPFSHGINCVRGQAAMAISDLLYADQLRVPKFHSSLRSLMHDRILSVRACAICAITPILNSSPDEAIQMFLACCQDAEELWATDPFQRFIHYAERTHYSVLRPLLQTVLSNGDAKATENVATQIILADLSDIDTMGDADRIRSGDDTARRAASNVYACNVGNADVGDRAAHHLLQFVDDQCAEVRKTVSWAFWHVDGNQLLRLEPHIWKFIESKSFETDPDPLLHALENSRAELPHVVYRAAERLLDFVREDGSSIAHSAASAAHSVSKLIVRLYAQTRSQELKLRCLDLIDRMERLGYMGITDELEKIDR